MSKRNSTKPKKRLQVTKKARDLVRELVEAAGENYWQSDQGSREEVIKAAFHREDKAETALLHYIANLQRQITNLKGTKNPRR